MTKSEMTEQEQRVYVIHPRLGGFANDFTVETEDGTMLFHVKSELLALSGRRYTVHDEAMREVLKTKQDHTVLFPRHTVLEDGRPVAWLGQQGVIPQNYFLELTGMAPLRILIPLYGSVFNLEGQAGVVAEIARRRSSWIVATGADHQHTRMVALIAIVLREYTIGG